MPPESEPWDNLTIKDLSLHGPAVEIECAVPALDPAIDRLFAPFMDISSAPGLPPLRGTIQPYCQLQVSHSISPSARRIANRTGHGEPLEIHEEGERFPEVVKRLVEGYVSRRGDVIGIVGNRDPRAGKRT